MMIGGEDDGGEASRSDLRHPGAGHGRHRRARRAARSVGGTAEQGYLHCGPNGAGHFVKMVHNGIEYGIMAAYAEGWASCSAPTSASRRTTVDAETTPLRDPEHYQYDFNLPRHRRGVAARQRDRLVAARPDGRRALLEDPELDEVRRPGLGLGRGPLDDQGRHRRGACRPTCSPRRSTSASARAARRTSPTSCSRPCATSSAAISRSPRADRDRKPSCHFLKTPEIENPHDQRAARSTGDQHDPHAVDRRRAGRPTPAIPGTPMALAPLVYTLWNRVMRFDPKDPIWPNRDRFVLSNGHASMLLWSVLHLTRHAGGQRRVRSAGQAVGHARRHQALPPARQQARRAIRSTTGCRASRPPPARWGRASPPASAWRSAQKWLATRYNRPGFDIFDYDIYAVCGDGCLMEGVGAEAASLAGHLELDNLCWIYDNNHITIEGNTRIAFTEDVAARFVAYGWNVLRVGDANDLERIEHALASLHARPSGRPTLIILDSHIGYGSPHKQDTAAAHGEPLGDEEVKLTKRAYGWPEDAKFLVPDGVLRAFRRRHRRARRRGARDAGTTLFADYKTQVPGARAPRSSRCSGASCPPAGTATCRVFPADAKGVAGRDASGKVLNVLAQNIPWFLGGSADLGPSNKTTLKFEARATSSPAATAAATCTSASASMRWRRSSTACRCRSCGRSARPSSSSATTRAPSIRLSALMELPDAHRLHARRHGRRRGRPDAPADRAARRRCARCPA